MANDQRFESDSCFLLRMRLVSRITLIVSAMFCVCILLVLAFISRNSGTTYDAAINSLSMSLRNLGPALLITSLLLMFFSIVVTRMISHRTSLRIAGPLYRFARNIEAFIEHGLVAPVPTRQDDQLKPEKLQIERSIAKLQAHYDALRTATETALTQIDSQQNPAAAIARLKDIDRATRL
ncbi:MAG: hypothetical protein OEV15_09205 [Gallionella sp.]|nr:hypothetical protein [Gallionella sp.]